jgi:hypothetical protein
LRTRYLTRRSRKFISFWPRKIDGKWYWFKPLYKLQIYKSGWVTQAVTTIRYSVKDPVKRKAIGGALESIQQPIIHAEKVREQPADDKYSGTYIF